MKELRFYCRRNHFFVLKDRKSKCDTKSLAQVVLTLQEGAVTAVQARVRRRVLRACGRRGLLDQSDAVDMGGWGHGGGFSVDASVCVACPTYRQCCALPARRPDSAGTIPPQFSGEPIHAARCR